MPRPRPEKPVKFRNSRTFLTLTALALAASVGACRRAMVIVPQPANGYSARDTLYGYHKGNRVQVTFRFDTLWRVDTVTRTDTLWASGNAHDRAGGHRAGGDTGSDAGSDPDARTDHDTASNRHAGAGADRHRLLPTAGYDSRHRAGYGTRRGARHHPACRA
jgi:hypothetical protein